MIKSIGLNASSAVGGAALAITLRAAKEYFSMQKSKIRLLDVGCGAGAFIEKLPPYFDAVGVDYNGVAEIKLNVSYEKLPFTDNTFDIVTAWQVFEHLENPFFAGREIQRVLCTGGVCLVSVPNIYSAWSRLIFLFRGVLPRWNNYNDHIFIPLKSVFKKSIFAGCAMKKRLYADGRFPSSLLAKNEYYVFQKL